MVSPYTGNTLLFFLFFYSFSLSSFSLFSFYFFFVTITPVEYKDFVIEWINNGASVIGGCCRTTTDHIKEIKKIVEKL
jgi:hypothetical protein